MWRAPLPAVCSIALLLPSYLIRFSVGPIPLNLLDVFIVAGFLAWLGHERGQIDWHGWFWPCIVFVLAGIYGTLVAPAIDNAMGQLKSLIIEPVLVFILIINVVRTSQERELLVRTILASGLLLSIVTLIQYFCGYGIPEPWNIYPERRATAWFGYPNAIGLYLAPIFALAFGTAIWAAQSRFTRWMSISTAVLIPGAVWAAHTEGAYMAIAGVILFFGLWTPARWWWVGGAIVALCVSFFIPTVREILLFQDVSGDVRLALWEGTWNLLRARPLQGSGLAGFAHWYDVYRLPSHVELLQYSHNSIFDFWTQLTLLGLVAAAWIYVKAFALLQPIKNVFNERPFVVIGCGALIATLIYGVVDVPYFKNDLAVLFWIVIGLMVVNKPRQKA